MTDYISSKKWSKEDALKPENLKELKKLTKQNDEKTKAAIEKHFASKDEKKDTSKKEATKNSTTKKSTTSKNATVKKPASKKTATKKPSETKAEPAGEPSKKGKDVKSIPDFGDEEEKTKAKPEEKKDALKFFDNKLLDVQAKGNAIGFIFSKSKAEISLEKKYTDALEI